jgi:predicted esterase
MKKLIVFLHGFGYTKEENMEAQNMIKEAFPNHEYIGIDAPNPSGRARGGYAWFYVTEGKREPVFDERFDNSISHLQKTINNKLSETGLSWKDIIFVGRSQGAYLSILIASMNEAECSGVITLGSRFVPEYKYDVLSKPKIFWFEMDEEISSRAKLDNYKYLLENGFDLKYLRGINSNHDFISPETTDEIIKIIKNL